MKALLGLALPGALVLLAAFTLLALATESPLLGQATRGYPYIALALAALLAWRLNASRLFAAALLMALTHALLHPNIAGTAPVSSALAATVVPLVLALLALLSDVSVTSARGRRQYVRGALAVLGACVLAAMAPWAVFAALTWSWLDPIYTDWSNLPPTALLLWTIALCAGAAAVWRTRSAVAAGLLWTTLAALFALAAPAHSPERGLWVLAAGAALLIAAVERSHFMAYHDELTRLPGRRALEQLLGTLQPPYTIAVVDVDHFKSFNDRHGHDVGDEVLRMVAGKLAAVTGGGSAFRSGGEEFVVVFPYVSKADAALHMEALRVAVADCAFVLRKQPRPRGRNAAESRGAGRGSQQRLSVTISIGLASPGKGTKNSGVESVLKSADKAMYRAKQAGRNRVAV